MGYFLQKFGIKFFNEAEVDGQDMNNPDDQSNDYTDTEDQQPPAEPENEEQQPVQEEPEQNADDNQDQDQNMDMPQEEPTTDYTEEDTETGDDPNQDNGPPSDNGEDGEQPVDDIKQQEEELYSNLTADQLDIKHKELKSQFLAMYDVTTSIIERIGDASISEENIGIVEYVSDNLSRLRTMLTDYIDSVYAGKSYIENSINYNRFLAVLNGINKILEQVEKKEDK